MTGSILTCVICGKPVLLQDARSDGDGKPVHEDCYIKSLPKYVAISPYRWTALAASPFDGTPAKCY